MFKFEIGNKIKITSYHQGYYDGKTGEILDVYIDLDVEPVYLIKYDNSSNKGMFRESSLILIEVD